MGYCMNGDGYSMVASGTLERHMRRPTWWSTEKAQTATNLQIELQDSHPGFVEIPEFRNFQS